MSLQCLRKLHGMHLDASYQTHRQLLLIFATAASLISAVLANAASFDGPAELPRVFINSAMSNTPAPGKVLTVAAGQNLQNALNNANCGDTIRLQAGATFTGSFTLPAKNCDDQHWIIIRTSAPDSALPSEGARITPCYAGVGFLPGRPVYPCSTPRSVLARIVYSGSGASGPIGLAPGANHYRLVGLEITRATGLNVMELVLVRHAGTANNIIIDRSWLHGTAHDDTATGFVLSGITYGAVVDSYFSDFHCTAVTDFCMDAHAVGGGGGNNPGGPYKIANNYLEASGENILFGGSSATATPSDIEIRHNHLFKPILWKPGAAGFIGGKSGNPFRVKNHFELKNAQRVLFEGNILENVWGGFSQNGFSVLLTPKNQTSNGSNVCPSCQVTDITIRYSTISHAGAGMQIATALSDTQGMAWAGERYSIHDLTIDDINASKYNGSGTFALVQNSWPTNVLSHVAIDHVTGFTDPKAHLLTLMDVPDNPLMGPFALFNSIVVAGTFPVWSAGGGPSNCASSDVPIVSLSKCFTAYTFNHNALIGVRSTYPPSNWPAGNDFPASIAAVGFVNPKNGVNGDYHLLSTSPYKNAGTDGKDLGADINAIKAATTGAY
jgi:hypothetical protein